MENKLKISKSKSLVEASYRLSLDEKRIIQYAITKVNPFKHSTGKVYFFSVLDLARCFNLNEKSCYQQLGNIVDQLFERRITYWDSDTKSNVTCRFLSCKMDNGKGVLGLKFSDEVSGMLVNDRDFLSYAIRHTVAFSSASAMRIYEMILYQLQRCPAKQLTKKIEIKRLKEILGLQDNYTRFSSFNSRVLGPAKNQINKHSDISISYTIVKEGRTPVSVKFVAKYKKTKQDKENTKNLLGTHETQEELEIIDSTNNTGIYSHSQTEKSNLDLTKDQLDFIRYSADNSGLPADLLLGECIKRNKSGLKLSDIILDSIKAVKEDFGLL